MRELVHERQRAMSPADRQLSRRLFSRWTPRTDVRLAAAIALLAGYVPRKFFDDFAATFSRIEFAPPSEFDTKDQIAGSFTVLDTGEIIALVNERHQHEDPALVATTAIVHESFHHDQERTSLEEEATARIFEHLVLLDLASGHPEILRDRTELVRGQLTQLLAIVYNSRTVLAGRCPSILPGGDVTVSDFFTEGPLPDKLKSEATPVSPALRTMWRHHGHLGPPPARHSKAMLRQLQIDALIDTPGDSLGAEDLIRVAKTARFQLP